MPSRARKLVSAFFLSIGLCLFFRQLTLAYEFPLKPADIHDAYVLGLRNDQATAEFFNPYIKQLTAGAKSPDIAQIEILTPFAQVADRCRRNASANYTEAQAMDDYRRQGDKIIVQVTLVIPAAYAKAAQPNAQQNPPTPEDEKDSSLHPENFWQNFRFTLKQHGKTIATRSMHNQPVYSTPTADTPSILDGATVWLEYDAKDIASEQATVEVLTPEPKTITAAFDLSKLR